jgi:cytidylate kinase
MARIITISREFGSGGRELGKRLADALGVPCYDQQILEMVAQKHGVTKDYVSHISEMDLRNFYPTTIGRGFVAPNYALQQSIDINVAQNEIMRELASTGDCVIVGRCADVILQDLSPLCILVYADMESKLRRCMAHRHGDEHLTESQMRRKIQQIGKRRRAYRLSATGKKWGHKESYHICVNTSGKEIKNLIPGLVAYVNAWFGDAREETE